jgi:hypothetical protein
VCSLLCALTMTTATLCSPALPAMSDSRRLEEKEKLTIAMMIAAS